MELFKECLPTEVILLVFLLFLIFIVLLLILPNTFWPKLLNCLFCWCFWHSKSLAIIKLFHVSLMCFSIYANTNINQRSKIIWNPFVRCNGANKYFKLPDLQHKKEAIICFGKKYFNTWHPDPGWREKINLNVYFHTSLWCLKTFKGTTKKCENKNLSLFLF